MFKIIRSIFLYVFAIHFISALTLDRKLKYKTIIYKSKEIPKDINGLEIGFITDIHDMREKTLMNIAERISKIDLDLLLIGGDFSETDFRKQVEIIGKIKSKVGIYSVSGNHDSDTLLNEIMPKNNIQLLTNKGIYITNKFYLAGVGDPKTKNTNVPLAVENAKEDDFVILISHNPDITMVQDMSKVNLTLSGHTHGGHISFFGLYAPTLLPIVRVTKYGQRFRSGWSKATNGSDVFVSNGIGSKREIPRIFARPQMILLKLESSK